MVIRKNFAYVLFTSVLAAGLIGCSTARANSSSTAQGSEPSSDLLSQISKMIPTGATIIPQGTSKVLSVHMNNDNNTEYVVLYKYQKLGIKVPFAGALIFTDENDKVQKLWQYTGDDVVTASIVTKDLLNNGKQEVIFKGETGAMANQNEILVDENGRIHPIFNAAAYRLDIIHVNGSDELATWTQDTGDLYNIQVYSWNKNSGQYQVIPNNKAPSYFTNIVIPYYSSLAKTKNGKAELRGIDYNLAEAYYDAGQDKQALGEISSGLKINGDYPSDSQFQTLQKQIEYTTYMNQGYGYSVKYPATWTAGPSPANNDGRDFYTSSNVSSFSNGLQGNPFPDSDVVLTAVGVPNDTMEIGNGQTFQEMLNEYKNKVFPTLKHNRNTVSASYSVIPNQWICTVSTQETGKNALEYEKQYMSMYKIETIQLVFPSSDAQKYKTVIQDISQSFNPGSPSDF